MNKPWNEMNGKEKVLVTVCVLAGLAGVVFAVLDMTKVWAYAEAGWRFTFAIALGAEGARCWQYNRKIAIVDCVLCAILLGFGVLSYFL